MFAERHSGQSLSNFRFSIPAPAHLTLNSHRIISFTDPHPLTTIESYRCKNRGGRVYRSGPQLLLLSKLKATINHAESTLLQVFFLKNLKPFGITTFERTGRGVPIMVNHLLETRHPLSSSPVPLCVSLCDPSSILRTHFQVPYPASPLLACPPWRATLTKTPGVWRYSSRFGTGYSIVGDSTRPEAQDASTFGRTGMFPPTRNRTRLPHVSTSKLVLAAYLFLLVTDGHATNQDNSASRVPVPSSPARNFRFLLNSRKA